MARIKNRSSVPALPVAWTDRTNNHKVYWDAAREPFLAFMTRINAYCDGNNKGRPPESEVEEQVCAQFPAWACDGPVNRDIPERNIATTTGCSSCRR